MYEVFLTNRGSSYPLCRGQSDAHPHVQVNLRHDTRECPVLLRSFLKDIFNALKRRFTLPRLRVHADSVSARLSLARRSNLRHLTYRNPSKQVKTPLVRWKE